MKISALFCKVSKDLYLRSYQNTKPQKLWRSRCYSNSTVVPYIDGNRARQYHSDIAESVKVTSREMIKSSSPNPNHKSTIYFSLLDQINPNVYNTMILFYQNNPNNTNEHSFNTKEKTTKLLKQSLSEILVDYYPLAGRIHKNELIECNNEGVEFCEADVTEKNLTQFIENPSVKDLEALLPFQGNVPRHKNIVLSVQVNHFACGGMALGVNSTHRLVDGLAFISFIRIWCAKTRDSNHIVSPPEFNGASIFPPSKEFNDIITDLPVNDEERIGIRRLIFDKKTIHEMKAEAATNGSDNSTTIFQPTTNEVVIAFIWKHLAKFSYVVQTVNLRTKMVPPVPVNSFGSFAYFTISSASASSLSSSSPCVINDLKNSVKEINSDYIHDLMLSDKSLVKLKKQIYEAYEMHESSLYFSNLSKFSVYEADFGIGKPVWVCLPCNFFKNFVTVFSTPCGEGVEVWICMLEDDIATLDHSLSHLASPIVKPVSVY